MNTNAIFNVGVFAPVDAGKTTLVEQLLFSCNVLRKKGFVDKGTTFTDSLLVEKERKITVQSVCVSMPYKNNTINLIDTPGHMDFIGQVENSLNAIDSAILMLSVCDSIKAHAVFLYNELQKRKIPVIIFLNKIDRANADLENTLAQITSKLNSSYLFLSDEFFNQMIVDDSIYEAIANIDEETELYYLNEEKIDYSYAKKAIKRCLDSSNIPIIISGSALTSKGIDNLLDSIISFFRDGKTLYNDDITSGIVFATSEDKSLGRLAHVRLFQGSIKNREIVKINSDTESKISQIKHIHNNTDIGYLNSGGIAKVAGLDNVHAGDIIGSASLPRFKYLKNHLKSPLLEIEISSHAKDLPNLHKAISKLEANDPLFSPKWSSVLNSYTIQIVGQMQIEILEDLLVSYDAKEFSISAPRIIFKETIAKKSIGHERYTMPKPCWAVITFELSPLLEGSGVKYIESISHEKIPKRYLKQIRQTIPIALEQGILGWEVTDLEIKLIDGEYHHDHTHPLDFELATPLAIMDGLNKNENILLEPILLYTFKVSHEQSGKIFSDILSMNGTYEVASRETYYVEIKAKIPLRTSLDYPKDFYAYTKGEGYIHTEFYSYAPCPIEKQYIAKRRTINPLNRSKYILAKRNALALNI